MLITLEHAVSLLATRFILEQFSRQTRDGSAIQSSSPAQACTQYPWLAVEKM